MTLDSGGRFLMKTFFVQTLGCKVNHYESEQIAALLLSRGLTPADADFADLRVINTCSVTIQAASQSRQSVRRMVRLPIFAPPPSLPPASSAGSSIETDPLVPSTPARQRPHPAIRPRVIVTGCWATSNAADASALPGVDAVLTHQHDVALELDRLLALWRDSESCEEQNGWKIDGETALDRLTTNIEPKPTRPVNGKLLARPPGTTTLPQLGQSQATRQRAFLKIQDGCDAHCTYCIIPTLRPSLWSKPVDQAVDEARALTAAGHGEIVLTGIFLGAYGQPTALRRRQPQPAAQSLGELINALCTRIPGLRRLRLSSLEPGDLTSDLLNILRSHPQVVPHFHLPLQSGSDALLRRMNRQYTRDDFLRMIDRVTAAFDRPALTTDVVAGFPGESDTEFERTVEVVRAAGFIHVHAFPYSPRPGTAAARWTKQFVRGPVVNKRIERLREIAADQSLAFRSSFLGQTVEVIIERDTELAMSTARPHHGRCERYFDVEIDNAGLRPGETVRATITDVTRERTVANALLPQMKTDRLR